MLIRFADGRLTFIDFRERAPLKALRNMYLDARVIPHETARLLCDAMARNGGLITLDDLKNYSAVERAPLRGTFRGYDNLTAPPPSSPAESDCSRCCECLKARAMRNPARDRRH